MANSDPGAALTDNSTGTLLAQVTASWQRGVRKALEKSAITYPQFMILSSLHQLSGLQDIVTQVHLSAHNQIDPMTTSGILRTLEKKGLITREEHPSDTRAKTVQLTSAGTKTTRQAIKVVERFDASFFSKLGSKTSQFQKQLLQLL